MRKSLTSLIIGLGLLATGCSYNGPTVMKTKISNLAECTLINYKGDKVSIVEAYCNSNKKLVNSKFYYFNNGDDFVQIDYTEGTLSKKESNSCSLESQDETCKILFKMWPYLR